MKMILKDLFNYIVQNFEGARPSTIFFHSTIYWAIFKKEIFKTKNQIIKEQIKLNNIIWSNGNLSDFSGNDDRFW